LHSKVISPDRHNTPTSWNKKEGWRN